jgi:hypothetical protein
MHPVLVQSRTSRNEDVHRSQASELFGPNIDKGWLRAKRLLQGIFDSQYEHGINVALAYPLVVTGNSERSVSTRLRIHKDRQDLNGLGVLIRRSGPWGISPWNVKRVARLPRRVAREWFHSGKLYCSSIKSRLIEDKPEARCNRVQKRVA